MNTPKIRAEVKKAEDGFALTVNGKAIQTPKGRPWICTSEQLARAAADDVGTTWLKDCLFCGVSFQVCVLLSDRFADW